MSSSSDSPRADLAAAAGSSGLTMRELGPVRWTRLGDQAVHGDEVTEQLLDRLAERARATASAQGYATGWAEGRRRGEASVRAAAARAAERSDAEEARREAEHITAMAALHEAAERLHGLVNDTCRRADEQAVTLALELTQELVGGSAPDREHVVRRVLDRLPDGPVATVRLHPGVAGDAAAITELGVPVVADASLGPADAVIETEDHLLDLRVETALARLREALS